MANLIERKRRRRRKETLKSFVCLHQLAESTNHHAEMMAYNQENRLLEPANTCLVAGHEDDDVVVTNVGHKCESENGIKHRSLPQANTNSSYSLRQQSRLTSAIHIMGQKTSLSLLLLLSIAFSFTILLPTNLIQLTEASGNNNQQLSQSQQQQRQMATVNSGFGGNTVIMPTSSNGKARYKTIYACEDTQLTMDCDFGSKINLIRANFGRFSITQCNEQGQLDLQTDCMSPITFRIMRERCQDKQKCSVNATSSIFGDKCPKTRKYLEVHFQCQQDQRQQQQQQVNSLNNYDQPDRVDLRNSSLVATPISHIVYPQTQTTTTSGFSPVLPPNNPTISTSSNTNNNNYARPVSNNIDESQSIQVNTPQNNPQQPQQAMTVMNSEIVSYNSVADSRASNGYNNANNNITQSANEQIIVTLRHFHTENMSNPRCVLWDSTTSQWTERGSRIVDTNLTHTICAFDQATSYLLVMDYLAPNPTISQILNPPSPNQQFYLSQANQQQPSVPRIGPPIPRILDFQPVLLEGNQQQDPATNKINQQQQQQSISPSSSSSLVKFFSLFGYMLAIVFVAIAFITVAFIASTMRTSGTTLKSLGNFTAFGGPKYKNRRADEGLHNKDLLVINNQNGHQFLYAPASTTKINSNSTSTHILPGSLAAQGTLHQHIQQQQHLQQQQMYSGTNGTLSNLSATGGQSNYYYGLMGSLFQQQQQHQSQLQHHLSTLHLNQQMQQQQQGLQATNYQHQTDKSTLSNESSNSTPSSSGVESASTSLHQQQQPQSCLMMNSEYNLMGQVNNYNQQQQQTILSSHHYQPQLTLNAHYSSSGPMNMGASQQQRLMINNNNQLIREHIYESVDDDKQQCMARGMFHPTDEQLFNSNTMGQQQGGQQANLNRAMTLSSRLLQNAIQHQQQPLINSNLANNNTTKRLTSHPAIVRDNQTKTNIICSKMAQVTPQRATEINKFQHDIMAIFNGTDTTTTTASTAMSSPSNVGNSSGFNRSDLVGDLGGVCSNGVGSKVSTDC